MEKKEGGTLHHWFKGSRSKDGKPGWVQADGSPCANEPGETKTPKCFSSGRLNKLKKSKKGKAIIRSAVRRKRQQDPSQQQKSGASSPTFVKTFAKGKKDPLYIKAEPKLKEEMNIQEASKDRPGKGSGTKDACYYKVKSRYRVFPSAYSSGALVQCRKKGADNWGNKNEGYVYESKKYCTVCMKKKVKCKCSRMPITEARKRDNVTNALLALSFAANVAQSPKHLLRSGHIEGPSVQLMSRMMKRRGKATVSGLDNARVSHPARNRKIEEDCIIDEGRILWSSSVHPLKSGWTPEEKNRAKMKSLEKEAMSANSNPETIRRYASLMSAHQNENERERGPRASLPPRHRYRLEMLHNIDVGQSRRQGVNSQERMLPSSRSLSGNAKRRIIYRTSNLRTPRKPLKENSKEALVKLILAALANEKKRKNYLLNYGYIGESKYDKSNLQCNKPKADPVGDSLTGKSHVVKACEGGAEKLIRFGQRGVKGSPKKKGESKAYASRRHRFQLRHAKNIAKGKMSAAYWANKVKW